MSQIITNSNSHMISNNKPIRRRTSPYTSPSSCTYCQHQCSHKSRTSTRKKISQYSDNINSDMKKCRRTKRRTRPSYKYSALHAAAAFFLHVQAATNVHASSPNPSTHTHKRCMPRNSCAFVSKSCEMKRTVQHGELESACGFRDANKYNTKMETEMGTECDFRQQHAQLRNSISYKPIPYRGANGVLVLNGLRGHDAEAAATTNGKIEVQPIMAQKEDTDTYLTLIKEQDVKIKLTNAINKVLRLDSSSKIQNGHAVHSLDMDGLELAPPTKYLTIRNLWKRRHARTIEEGIRRERIEPTTTEQLLSTVLDETTQSEDGAVDGKGPKKKQRFAARTIAGLISALAEEATGLEVEVDARNDTPFWGKQIDAVKINFSRLGVKALRMGGLDEALRDVGEDLAPNEKESMADSLRQKAEQMYNDSDFGEGFAVNNSIDEVFDRIDVDNSGALDEKELAGALSIASGLSADDESDTSAEALSKLASKLVSIYDVNGDGVVDRKEYRKLVEDMAAVRDAQRTKERDREEKRQESLEKKGGIHPLKWAKIAGTLIPRWASKDSHTVNNQEREITSASSIEKKSNIQGKDLFDSTNSQERDGVDFAGARDISNDSSFIDTISKGEGSIVFTDLKLDLRRLLFGAVPLLKRITPGGPLILEPFTTTFKGSFSKEDILESGLLDDGLRRLVARALRRRVRSLRDLLDGAVFYGRTWNTASKQAPVVEVQKLTNIEFDSQDRMIITGRAKIRTSPDQPSVENSFKLRTRLGTRENGRYIRLEDPELALVLECPKAWERNIVSACKNLNMPVPKRPEPLYKFIPLVSPIQKTEQDGFNLGDDNRIKSIFVKDDALRFEMSCVLRPGRFLGNHYLAFTVPNRTFIITMDRIKAVIRTARQNKKELERSKRESELNKKQQVSDRYKLAVAQALSSSTNGGSNGDIFDLSHYTDYKDEELSFIDPKEEETYDRTEEAEIVANRPGFFGRFLEGYLEAAREETEKERNERLVLSVSEFFSPDDVIENEIQQ